LRAGRCFSWPTDMPQRRIEPSVWISRGLSMFLLPIPSGGRAVLTRATDGLLLPATTCGGALFTQPAKLQEPGRSARSLCAHRVCTCHCAPFRANPAFASCWLYRLRVACRGCFVVLCCDGCNVSVLTCICQAYLLKYFKSANFCQ